MSLRPRYSLLTLLVLTALSPCAGGVKLWYGPHHVVLHDPPSVEEQEMLTHFLRVASSQRRQSVCRTPVRIHLRAALGTREYLHVRLVPWDSKKFPIVPENRLLKATRKALRVAPDPFSRGFCQSFPWCIPTRWNTCTMLVFSASGGKGMVRRPIGGIFLLLSFHKGTVYTTNFSDSARGHGTLFLALTSVV